MTAQLGMLVFARYDSKRLPGKALRTLGGMPLLERVIRRAQTLPWPVYLATTQRSEDDALVDLAHELGVRSFRGSEDRVLDRGAMAAQAFGLDAFARICADRPLFPLDTLTTAMQCAAHGEPVPDLVTNCLPEPPPAGLTTEVVRTEALLGIMVRDVTAEQQEHMTRYFYDHARDFRIVSIANPVGAEVRRGLAVDTASDLAALNAIFDVAGAVDLSVADAERLRAQ